MAKRVKSVKDSAAIHAKLDEAEFFLRRMEETVGTAHDYGCYFSAFLSAFHSATARFDRFSGLTKKQVTEAVTWL